MHYPRLENLMEEEEDEGEDEEDYHPRLEGDENDDEDDVNEVITVLPAPPSAQAPLSMSTSNSQPPSSSTKAKPHTTQPTHSKPSKNAAPASLGDIKKLMKEMEERHDKFLDRALDELQGSVADTLSKLDERLSSLEDHVKDQHAQHPNRPNDRPPKVPTLRLHTQNLPAHTQNDRAHTQNDRYFGSALAAHANARNPRPPALPSSLPSSLPSAPHLRGGAASGISAVMGNNGDRDRGDGYREAALKVEDVGVFEGKDVEHYVRTLEIISDIYRERRLLLILPRCMKGVAKE